MKFTLRRNNAGFTMLEIAFAVIILSIVMTAFSAVMVQNLKVQFRVFHTKASMEIESVLDGWISTKLSKFFESLSDCQTLNSDMNEYFVQNMNLPKGYDVWVWNDPTSTSPHVKLDVQPSSDSSRQNAVSRCEGSQTPILSPNADAVKELYFCFRFLADRETTELGYFNYPSFVEIKHTFVNFTDNSKLTCGQYTSKTDPMRGGVTHYKLYTQCDNRFVSEGCLGGSFTEFNYGRNTFSGVVYAMPSL